MPNITPPSPNTNMSTVSGSSNSTLPSMNVTNVSAVSDMPAGNSASSPTVSAPQNITQGTLERQTTDEAMMLAEERDSSYSDQPSWDWLNEWQDDESARVSHRRVRRDGDQAACSDDQIEFNGGKLPKDYSNQESYNLTSITAELAKLNFTGILKEADKAQFAAEVIKQIIYKADKNTAALRREVNSTINYTGLNDTEKAYFNDLLLGISSNETNFFFNLSNTETLWDKIKGAPDEEIFSWGMLGGAALSTSALLSIMLLLALIRCCMPSATVRKLHEAEQKEADEEAARDLQNRALESERIQSEDRFLAAAKPRMMRQAITSQGAEFDPNQPPKTPPTPDENKGDALKAYGAIPLRNPNENESEYQNRVAAWQAIRELRLANALFMLADFPPAYGTQASELRDGQRNIYRKMAQMRAEDCPESQILPRWTQMEETEREIQKLNKDISIEITKRLPEADGDALPALPTLKELSTRQMVANCQAKLIDIKLLLIEELTLAYEAQINLAKQGLLNIDAAIALLPENRYTEDAKGDLKMQRAFYSSAEKRKRRELLQQQENLRLSIQRLEQEKEQLLDGGLDMLGEAPAPEDPKYAPTYVKEAGQYDATEPNAPLDVPEDTILALEPRPLDADIDRARSNLLEVRKVVQIKRQRDALTQAKEERAALLEQAKKLEEAASQALENSGAQSKSKKQKTLDISALLGNLDTSEGIGSAIGALLSLNTEEALDDYEIRVRKQEAESQKAALVKAIQTKIRMAKKADKDVVAAGMPDSIELIERQPLTDEDETHFTKDDYQTLAKNETFQLELVQILNNEGFTLPLDMLALEVKAEIATELQSLLANITSANKNSETGIRRLLTANKQVIMQQGEIPAVLQNLVTTRKNRLSQYVETTTAAVFCKIKNRLDEEKTRQAKLFVQQVLNDLINSQKTDQKEALSDQELAALETEASELCNNLVPIIATAIEAKFSTIVSELFEARAKQAASWSVEECLQDKTALRGLISDLIAKTRDGSLSSADWEGYQVNIANQIIELMTKEPSDNFKEVAFAGMMEVLPAPKQGQRIDEYDRELRSMLLFSEEATDVRLLVCNAIGNALQNDLARMLKEGIKAELNAPIKLGTVKRTAAKTLRQGFEPFAAHTMAAKEVESKQENPDQIKIIQARYHKTIRENKESQKQIVKQAKKELKAAKQEKNIVKIAAAKEKVKTPAFKAEDFLSSSVNTKLLTLRSAAKRDVKKADRISGMRKAQLEFSSTIKSPELNVVSEEALMALADEANLEDTVERTTLADTYAGPIERKALAAMAPVFAQEEESSSEDEIDE